MNNDEEVLFCNDAFYQAFLNRDMKAMDEIWATSSPVLCIHPGGNALTSREQIMSSWEGIISHEACPRILHRNDELMHYDGLTLLTCYEWDERQPKNILLTTNGFARENNRYYMVFHQTAPVPLGMPEHDEAAIPAIH